MAFRMIRARLPLALLVSSTLTLVACGDDEEPTNTNTDTSGDVIDDTADVGTDATVDVADTGADATDVGADTADVEPDAEPDTTPDTAPDVEPDATPGPIEIAEEYDTNFGGFVRVTADSIGFNWYREDVTITAYDNDGDWIIGQNSSDDPWNPDLWSRFDYSVTDNGILWCQTVFGAESEQAALDTPASDASDADAGCGGFSWTILTEGQGPIAISGDYDNGFGGFVGVGPTGIWYEWLGQADIAVTQFSNLEEWAVGQNAADDEFNPSMWSKVEWALGDGGFYFCQTAFDAVDEEAALAAAPADRANWETGCGGFAWSFITPGEGPNALEGAWDDNYGGAHTIEDAVWSQTYPDSDPLLFNISLFSNSLGYIIAQNDAANTFSPGRWSRFDWIESEGTVWYCQILFDGTTEEDAIAATAADATDPSTAGCGGAPWTQLTASDAE